MNRASIIAVVAVVAGVAVTVVTAAAHAETKRVAVIVGNNAGNGELAPLRYAEVDAGKVSRVLVELGGVAKDDLFLLQGKDLATLKDTLDRAKAKVAAYQKTGLDRVVLIFYYSGHSDGLALELGNDRFTFAALRQWLKDTGAEVRVGFIDSCKSGALLATKGGSPGPAFQIRLTDDLSSTGEALLTSSAADENALESKEIGGSFFTHHLVSGLRGAADSSGDARVTLSEAYQYAYKHTIATSGATLAGPQHPAYDYQLSGQGELVLTELAQPSAALALPDGFDRALVIEVARDQVIAELGPGAPAQLAVTPGRYGVRAWKKDQVFEGRVVVGANAVRAVKWDELSAITLPLPRAKGNETIAITTPLASAPTNKTVAIEVGFGIRRAVARDIVGSLPNVRVGGRYRRWALDLDFGTWNTSAVRETAGIATLGYRMTTSTGRLHAWLAGEVTGGFVAQSVGTTTSTGAFGIGPGGGIGVTVAGGVQLGVAGQVPLTLIEKEGEVVLYPLVAAWFGISISP